MLGSLVSSKIYSHSALRFSKRLAGVGLIALSISMWELSVFLGMCVGGEGFESMGLEFKTPELKTLNLKL